jgi:hypothetical protein
VSVASKYANEFLLKPNDFSKWLSTTSDGIPNIVLMFGDLMGSVDEVISPRSPPPIAFNSNAEDDDIPVYHSDDDSDAGPVYRPSSPAYSREGSASPEKGQEKSPAGPASRGGSPGARNDADVPRKEESAVNKHANILSDAREAEHEIVHVDSDPEGFRFRLNPNLNLSGSGG